MRGSSRIKRAATIVLILTALTSAYYLVKMGVLIVYIYESIFGAQAEIESVALRNFHVENSSIEVLVSIENPSHRALTVNRIEIFLYLNGEFLHRYIGYGERVIPPLSREDISLEVWIHDAEGLKRVSRALEADRWEWSAQGEMGFRTVLGSFPRKLEY